MEERLQLRCVSTTSKLADAPSIFVLWAFLKALIERRQPKEEEGKKYEDSEYKTLIHLSDLFVLDVFFPSSKAERGLIHGLKFCRLIDRCS